MYLYIDEYLLIIFKKESSLLKIEWRAESARLNAESFKSRMNFIYDYFAKHEPKHILTDCSHLVYRQFSGKEDLVIKRIGTEIYESEIDKLAIINSTDKITRTLINQTVYNPLFNGYRTKVFTNYNLAQSWLLPEKEPSGLQDEYVIST